jgi:uncharacterized protein DUF1257
MSHIAEVNLLVQDLNALQRACHRLGLELVRHQPTYRWYGTSVGDDPLPTGFAKEDLGTCEHAIRIPGNDRAYEIGIVTRRDGKPGYVLLWDCYQGGYGLVEHVGEQAERLQQMYALEVTLSTIEQMHHCVIAQTQLADGSIELVLAQHGV